MQRRLAYQILSQTMEMFEEVLLSVSQEKLFAVPKGFKNSIFWNYAHALAIQEVLLYQLAGLETNLPLKTIKQFSRGSEPSPQDGVVLLGQLKNQSVQAMKKLSIDLETEGLFEGFKPYYLQTFKYELTSFEDAQLFNNTHAAIHLGYAMAIRKALNA